MVSIVAISVAMTILRNLSILVEVEVGSRYVLVGRTGELKVLIRNVNPFSDVALRLRVKSAYGYLEIVEPVEELRLRVPAGGSHELHVFVRGLEEGVEKVLIMAEADERRYVETVEIQVTAKRAVYINLYAGFHIGSWIVYERPMAGDLRICPPFPSWFKVDIETYCKEVRYLGGNTYYEEIAEDTRTLIVAVILELPPPLPQRDYAVIGRVMVNGDTVDVLIPDVEMNLILTAISFLTILLVILMVKMTKDFLAIENELVKEYLYRLVRYYINLLFFGAIAFLAVLKFWIEVFISHFMGIYFFVFFVAVPATPVLSYVMARIADDVWKRMKRMVREECGAEGYGHVSD